MGFSILGKVELDSSGFYRGMTRLKAGAAPLGKQIGQQMRGAIMNVFGAAAFIGSIRRVLGKAFDIRSGAGKLGIDSEVFQTLETLSAQTGTGIDEMVEAMNSGTTSGLAFAEAVSQLNTQLRENSEILTNDQVRDLASMQDELNKLEAKVAPAIGGAAKVFGGLYDIVSKGINLATAGGMTAFGMLTGNKALTRAGREMSYETTHGPTDSESDQKNQIAETARTLATEIGKKTREQSNSGGTTTEKKSLLDGRLPVSGDTQVGRYFGNASGMRSQRDMQLELISRTLDSINTKIALFK